MSCSAGALPHATSSVFAPAPGVLPRRKRCVPRAKYSAPPGSTCSPVTRRSGAERSTSGSRWKRLGSPRPTKRPCGVATKTVPSVVRGHPFVRNGVLRQPRLLAERHYPLAVDAHEAGTRPHVKAPVACLVDRVHARAGHPFPASEAREAEAVEAEEAILRADPEEADPILEETLDGDAGEPLLFAVGVEGGAPLERRRRGGGRQARGKVSGRARAHPGARHEPGLVTMARGSAWLQPAPCMMRPLRADQFHHPDRDAQSRGHRTGISPTRCQSSRPRDRDISPTR